MEQNLSFGLVATYVVVAVAYLVLVIVGNWKIFSKAGKPGWGAIVPVYNEYLPFKIAEGTGTTFWISLVAQIVSGITFALYQKNGGAVLLIVALIASIVSLVLWVRMNVLLARSFGKGVGFGICLLLFPFICTLILGFGSARYLGPKGVAPAAPAAPEA